MYLKSHELSRLVDLYLEHESIYGKWEIILEKFNNEFDKNLSFEQARQKIKYLKKTGRMSTASTVEGKPKRVGKVKVKAQPKATIEELKITADGTHTSTKELELTEEQKRDTKYILNAHGYDDNDWEIVKLENKKWNAYSIEDKIVTLYSSTIVVKPKTKENFDYQRLLERIEKVKPFNLVIKPKPKGNRMLEIPFFDPHFGISTYEDYLTTQQDTLNIITSNDWEEILIIIGQDMLHHDNQRSQTASGTIIENVDIDKAWEDAEKFYYPILDASVRIANRVRVIYSKGNHDESLSHAFAKMIRRLYPSIDVDVSYVERKCHVYGRVFLGITHGDKARKQLHNIFPVEFPIEWANALTREIHIGHLHKEDAVDTYGMMIRTLATRNKTDKWHRDNGYIGNHKRFMLFEYSTTELRHIHYV